MKSFSEKARRLIESKENLGYFDSQMPEEDIRVVWG
jgi:hypothetical protein